MPSRTVVDAAVELFIAAKAKVVDIEEMVKAVKALTLFGVQ